MLTSNGTVLDESAHRLGDLVAVPDAARRDRATLWDLLRRDGYLFLPGLLDADDVRAFREFYFAAMAPTGLLAPDSRVVDGRDSGRTLDQAAFRHALFREVVPSQAYRDFCAQPALRGWFEWLFGEPAFLHRRKIIRQLRPGETGIGAATHAHYDLVYLREGTDRLLSAWIPLGDTPIERAPLIYLEGSHEVFVRQEQDGRTLPAGPLGVELAALAEEHRTRWLLTEFAAGDVMVHSPYMVHAALDNVDPEGIVRLSTDIRYQRAGDPIDWRWQHDWDPDDGL